MRNKFKIFVSYHMNTGTGWGFGNNTTYYANRKYLSNNDLRHIENELCENFGYKQVVIINYRFM